MATFPIAPPLRQVVPMEDKSEKKRWDGGRILIQKDGRRLFTLEKRYGGRRYHISTRAHSEKAAYEHLRRWEADPAAYLAEMEEGRQRATPVYMTKDLVLEFRRWCLGETKPARENPTTRRYANNTANRLFDWMEDIGSRDLRHLDLPLLHELLASRPGHKNRIIAIKAFFTWLRTKKFLVDRRQDPTLDLLVPQAIPEKYRRRKAVPHEHVRAALQQLKPSYRDCLLLVASTGWHTTELERFVRDPTSRIAAGKDSVLGVLQVRHKTGRITRTPVLSREVLEAAERLRARGQVPRSLNSHLATACKKAKVDRFTFGVIRHSVATWAVEAGTPPDVVAEFLGHLDKRTTARFYADVAVPTLPVLLPKLI